MKTHSTVLMMLLAAAGADAASISGVILPPGRAKGVQAFEREGAQLFKILNRYHKGTLDPKTGAFEIPDLPDGTYQLLIDCGDAKLEGVDLHIDDEEDGAVFDYVFKTKKLSVQRLDLSEHFDPDEVVVPEQRDRIAGKLMGVPKLIEKLDSLKKVDRFCEHVRPLIAHGTKDKVLVLVEKARLRDFHSGRGHQGDTQWFTFVCHISDSVVDGQVRIMLHRPVVPYCPMTRSAPFFDGRQPDRSNLLAGLF